MARATRRPVRGRALGALLALLALLPPAPAFAGPTPRAGTTVEEPTVTVVKIERVKPKKEKLPTLRFLHANRDFIRARFDRLRQESHSEAARAGDLDPRFLAYRKLLAEIAAAKDSVAVAAEARERAALFASVSDLATLERELDQMERLLESQRARLAVLQADFAGRQRTELDVVLTGHALAGRVDSVAVRLEDGSLHAAGLDSTQRESLRKGGVLEVFRGLVEPRDQVLEITLQGEGWSLTGPGYVTLEPRRDQLTFLKLDLSQAHPRAGLTSILAGTWCLDPGVPPLAPAPNPQPTVDSHQEAP
jgi:hypothetical protein